ncbi:MAG TPA: DUF309 domain-containing protein [Anaerolineales bacterium]|nr:DUF309 domain-containing protein [Anaerolineales bacterium]
MAEEIAPPNPEPLERQFAEHLSGREAILLDRLTLWKPALMIFDLGNRNIPWREWIALVTSVPATRRIPVLCYGSHVDIKTMHEASAAGAQKVVPRSRFVQDLPGLIQQYARASDREALSTACQEPLSPMAVRGLEEFNRGEYFEAHESLEAAWKADNSSGRELYQAVLQVAVAYYQILRGNYSGAAKMFLRLRQWIDPLPDYCRGVHVANLRAEAQAVHQELLRLGPERIADFDRSLLRPAIYQ